VRHEGTVKVKVRIREEPGDIAHCLPSVALAKEGGFPPALKLRGTGRIADFFTYENGGAFPLFSLSAPMESLPNQYGFRWSRNAVFWSFLPLFAENHHKLFAINNLQPKSSTSN
jgi:hypothetical protein